jgi:hypothetical protein
MKLLLDENLPKRLKQDFPEHEIYTIRDKNWNGKKNGELLVLMLEEGFDALLTFDRNLPYQQNFNKYSLPVLVLNAQDNTYATLKELIPQIKNKLKEGLMAGANEIKE